MLKDVLGYKNPEKRGRIFGGMTMLLGGDFSQSLPVIRKGKRIVEETYLDFTTRQSDDDYRKEREIITPRNDDADAINAYMLKKLGGDSVTYNSVDEICKASTDTLDQQDLYPVEFLNSLDFPRMPPHSLCLKKELPIMLLRNVNPSQGLCNGTRLIIIDLDKVKKKHARHGSGQMHHEKRQLKYIDCRRGRH
ncbi:ATP-dependent DNA helicase PIF1-like protein [Tanacetum coccineum]